VARFICLLGLAFPGLSVAGPVVIDYEVGALGPTGRYEYRYTLTNVALASPVSWFSVDFDTALYDEASLLITSTGLSDWSQQILGSVFANPAQYDAYKTVGPGVGIGSAAAGFSVAFTWLGAGAPSGQAFTIYDPATLSVLDSGRTTALGEPPVNQVPEPPILALVLLGLCGGALVRRRSLTSGLPAIQ
jgi:hypothetical protein